MDESLQIQRFDEIPSSDEFVSRIESRNVPAVFRGCIKDWQAFSKWNPSNGGLDYLHERIGSCVVEAMLSKSAPVFYGDIRSHERVALPFSAFIGFCKQQLCNSGDDSIESQEHISADSSTDQGSSPYADAPQQIYLAQVPIVNVENQDKVQLETLNEDIKRPAFLESKTISSINLWMNSSKARSSTHYDPHHNLLCIVAGSKQVVLWPPSASPMLYPMPLHGEASNHSSVSLENPDLSIYPRAKGLMEHCQRVILHAGDALFIPEGWFHQVDSDDFTIAVNFWWRSYMMCNMSEHMDSYYLRRILRRLTDKEMDQMLCKTNVTSENVWRHISNGEADYSGSTMDPACNIKVSKDKDLERRMLLHEMKPNALQALHWLISLVHDHISVPDQIEAVQSNSAEKSDVFSRDKSKKIDTANLACLEDDPIAKIIWNLEVYVLQDVLLSMANNFPRTLEALILYLLSPVGAEVLTRRFDEMDQLNTEEDRNKFYEVFYGAFDNQFAAMDVILARKESFALQAFRSVLNKYVGVPFNVEKPALG